MLWLRESLTRLLSGNYLLRLGFNLVQFISRTVSISCSRTYQITIKAQNTYRGLCDAILIGSPVGQVSTMT